MQFTCWRICPGTLLAPSMTGFDNVGVTQLIPAASAALLNEEVHGIIDLVMPGRGAFVGDIVEVGAQLRRDALEGFDIVGTKTQKVVPSALAGANLRRNAFP